MIPELAMALIIIIQAVAIAGLCGHSSALEASLRWQR